MNLRKLLRRKKERDLRTKSLDELRVEYNTLCAKLGDCRYKRMCANQEFDSAEKELLARLSALNIVATEKVGEGKNGSTGEGTEGKETKPEERTA